MLRQFDIEKNRGWFNKLGALVYNHNNYVFVQNVWDIFHIENKSLYRKK